MVDFGDLIIVLEQWGTAGPEGDVDRNGTVDLADLLAVLAAWGETCP